MNRARTTIDQLSTRHRRAVVASCITIGVALAWHFRFVQDDAFISYTYAGSLVEGHGLTWFGSHVEGYTNFLWVMWIALGMRLGIEPVAWAYVGGLASFAGCVWCLWAISRRMFKELIPALLSLLFFICNFSVLSYATGGLETMLQTFLLALLFLLATRLTMSQDGSPLDPALLSLVLAASLLTRLDSAVIAGVILLFVIRHLHADRSPARTYVALLLPAALILSGWFAWRMSYYGRLLPNTYYAKVGWDATSFGNGLLYLWRFLHWYLIWPFLLLGILGLSRSRKKIDQAITSLMLMVAAWSLYIIAVGGDFMEFRFIIPMTPFLFLLLAYLVYYHGSNLFFKSQLVAAILSMVVLTAASGYHGSTFKELTEDKRLDSIEMLSSFYGVYPDHNWKRIGEAMRQELSGTGASISTSAVGSIPFYSGLRTVDAIGLCDTNVNDPNAFAPATSYRPGHGQRVNLSYLRQQGVNFVLDQPVPIVRGVLNRPEVGGMLAAWLVHAAHRDGPPNSIETAVAMPLDDRTSLLMMYLTPTAVLDSVIQTKGWEVARVRMY